MTTGDDFDKDRDSPCHSPGKMHLQDMLSSAHQQGPREEVLGNVSGTEEGDEQDRSPNPAAGSPNESVEGPIGGPGSIDSPYDAHHMASDLLDKLRESQMQLSQLESVMEDKEYAAKQSVRELGDALEERLAEEKARRAAAEEKLHENSLQAARLQVPFTI